MSNFVKGTISVFTSYAIQKMNEIIGEKSSTNLSKIIISDSEYELSEDILLENINYNYAFPVVETKNDIGSEVTTLIAEIPEEIVKLNIKTIGLVDTDENGIDHLFAVAKVNLYKPTRAECHYNLVIQLNYALKVVKFELENLSFYVNVPEYGTGDDLEDFIPAINTDIIALEHAIMENAILIGANRPQVVYRDAQEYFAYFGNYVRVLEYLTANEIGGGTLIDAFFNDPRSFYFAYSSLNLAKYEASIKKIEDITYTDTSSHLQYITRNSIDFNNPDCSYMHSDNNIISSRHDTVNLINAATNATTLVLSVLLNGDLEAINKKGDTRFTNCDILYKCEETNDNSRIFSLSREQNQLTGYTIWEGGFLSFRTKLTRKEMVKLCDEELHFITMIFNKDGETDADKFKLYIDKSLKQTEIVYHMTDEYNLFYAPYYDGIHNLSFTYDKENIEDTSKYNLWLDRNVKSITTSSDSSKVYVETTETTFRQEHTIKLAIDKLTKTIDLYRDNTQVTDVEFEYKNVANEPYKSHSTIINDNEQFQFSLKNYSIIDGVADNQGNYIDKILCFKKELTYNDLLSLISSIK